MRKPQEKTDLIFLCFFVGFIFLMMLFLIISISKAPRTTSKVVHYEVTMDKEVADIISNGSLPTSKDKLEPTVVQDMEEKTTPGVETAEPIETTVQPGSSSTEKEQSDEEKPDKDSAAVEEPTKKESLYEKLQRLKKLIQEVEEDTARESGNDLKEPENGLKESLGTEEEVDSQLLDNGLKQKGQIIKALTSS